MNNPLPGATYGVTNPLWGLDFSDPFFRDAAPWMSALGVVLAAAAALLCITVYLVRMKGTAPARAGEAAGSCSTCSDRGFEKCLDGRSALSRCLGHTDGARALKDPGT